MINNQEFRVFGLKRSGNHAIINWLFYQIPGVVVFLNNCYPSGSKLNLYTGIGEIKCKGVNYWDFKKKIFFFEKNRFSDTKVVEYSREDKRFQVEKLKQVSKNGLIISFENKEIDKMNYLLDQNHDQLVGESQEIFQIIILRDPFNLLASFYKKWGDQNINKVVLQWKEYAKLFLEYQQKESRYFLGVNYNHWVVDVFYRKEIVTQLDIPFDDSAKNMVTEYGGGSSFDELSYQSNAEQMSVFFRWKAFVNDENFRSLFEDQELIDLAHEIFGELPETDSLFR